MNQIYEAIFSVWESGRVTGPASVETCGCGNGMASFQGGGM